MKVVPNKSSTRGGYRIPKPLRLSTSRLLAYLFDKYGGPVELAKDLDLHHQHVCMWRTRGYVPLKWVGPISRQLKCTTKALNYEGCINLTGSTTSWAEVVESNVGEDKPYAYILNGKLPKTPEQILGDKS